MERLSQESIPRVRLNARSDDFRHFLVPNIGLGGDLGATDEHDALLNLVFFDKGDDSEVDMIIGSNVISELHALPTA